RSGKPLLEREGFRLMPESAAACHCRTERRMRCLSVYLQGCVPPSSGASPCSTSKSRRASVGSPLLSAVQASERHRFGRPLGTGAAAIAMAVSRLRQAGGRLLETHASHSGHPAL